MTGNVKNALAKAPGQSGNVILDAREANVTLKQAIKGVQRAFGADARLKVVRVIGKDFDVTIPRQQQ